MKYIIDEQTGSVYARGSDDPSETELYNEVFQAPLEIDNTFDTENGCSVDNWESPSTEYRIKIKLGLTAKCPTCGK
jgi:hypothetical protein